MKKLLIILSLLSYLFAATDLKELLKIKVVFEHYSEHKEKDKSLSFLDFIEMHYLTDDNNDKDNDKDNKLPYKEPGNCIASLSFAFITHFNPSIPFNQFPGYENLFYPVNDSFPVMNYRALVWNPPQI